MDIQKKLTKYSDSRQMYNKQINKYTAPDYVYVVYFFCKIVGDVFSTDIEIFNTYEKALIYFLKLLKEDGIVEDEIEKKLGHLNQQEKSLYLKNLNLNTLSLLSDVIHDDNNFFYAYKDQNHKPVRFIVHSVSGHIRYEAVYQLIRKKISTK